MELGDQVTGMLGTELDPREALPEPSPTVPASPPGELRVVPVWSWGKAGMPLDLSASSARTLEASPAHTTAREHVPALGSPGPSAGRAWLCAKRTCFGQSKLMLACAPLHRAEPVSETETGDSRATISGLRSLSSLWLCCTLTLPEP